MISGNFNLTNTFVFVLIIHKVVPNYAPLRTTRGWWWLNSVTGGRNWAGRWRGSGRIRRLGHEDGLLAKSSSVIYTNGSNNADRVTTVWSDNGLIEREMALTAATQKTWIECKTKIKWALMWTTRCGSKVTLFPVSAHHVPCSAQLRAAVHARARDI